MNFTLRLLTECGSSARAGSKNFQIANCARVACSRLLNAAHFVILFRKKTFPEEFELLHIVIGHQLRQAFLLACLYQPYESGPKLFDLLFH